MDLIGKIIREAEKSLITLHFYDGFKTVSLEYDPDCKVYKTSITAPCRPRNAVIGKENAYEVLKQLPESVLKETMDKIQEEIDRYYSAKLRLIRLALANFKDSDIIKILKVLDQVCVSYRYVGNGNRFYINDYTHVRLTDETGWNNEKNLHLQKVIANRDDNMTLHAYPEDTELDILKEIASL